MMSEPEQGVAGRALLLSKDPVIGQQLTAGMRRFAIAAELCSDTRHARHLLNTRKFEAVVVDLAISDSAASLLQSIRASPSNQSAVTFAIVDRKSRHTYKDLQAQFVIERDGSNTLLSNMLKVALGLIIREHRRYFRCAVDLPASVTLIGGSKAPCKLINLSEGGAAIQAGVNFTPGAQLRIDFRLGGTFSVGSEICWCDKNGRSGLRFRRFEAEQKLQLQEWLSRQLEQNLPEPVAQLFSKTD